MQTTNIVDEKTALLSQIDIPEDLRHLIPGFVERRIQDVEILRGLIESGEFDEIKKHGHRIKGHGKGYGFDKISDCGDALEKYAGARNEEAVRSTLAEYETYVRFISENLNQI
ncbi:MAG: Hpt domain-containing protein [Bdellovibrionaceae bacterium]|nr:Hpt domain-containing protein [Pseudobdellovibrionaceae bacterium]|tara:strand:+ start:4966 stop:5304 length:339 start_codon:yes stop_codon:yes gene_type:complete